MPRFLICSLVASAFLIACGSDDDGPSRADATAPAKLDTAEQAAQAAAFFVLFSDLDEAADFSDFNFAGEGGNRKRTISDNCAIGGSYTFTDEGGANGVNDFFRFQFDNCQDQNGRLDGQIELSCGNGEFDGQGGCSSTSIAYGANNRRFSVNDNEGNLSFLGNWQLSNTSGVLRLNHSLDIRANTGSRSLVAISDSYNKRVEAADNGGALLNLSGSVGVAFDGPEVDCNSGRVTITTLEQIQVDAAGTVRGGRIEITNSGTNAGGTQTAEIAFANTGDVTVTIDGVSATPIPRSRFERYCTID